MFYSEVNNNEIDKEYLNNIFVNYLIKIKSKINYSIKDLIKYLELEIFKYNKKYNYKVHKVLYCEDEFSNPYLYVEFNPFGSILFSLLNNNSIFINPIDSTRKIDKLDLKCEYLFNFSNLNLEKKNDTNFCNIDNYRFKNLSKNKIDINKQLKNTKLIKMKEELNNRKNISLLNKKNINSVDPRQEIINADVELPYSWWFKGLKYDFGYTIPEDWGYPKTDYGLCHYIAASILLQYNQLFFSNKTLSEKQQQKYMEILNNSIYWKDKKNIATTPIFNSKMVYDLWEKGDFKFATTHLYMKNTINSFIQQDKKYNPLNVQTRIFGSIRPWKWIDDCIPTMIMGQAATYGYHAIIPYGYYKNENKYLVHYGWEGYSQVIMDTSFLNETWLIGISPKSYAWKVREDYFLLNNRRINLYRYESIVKATYKYPPEYPYEDYHGAY